MKIASIQRATNLFAIQMLRLYILNVKIRTRLRMVRFNPFMQMLRVYFIVCLNRQRMKITLQFDGIEYYIYRYVPKSETMWKIENCSYSFFLGV